MKNLSKISSSPWTPTRPASGGSTAYHNAVVNTSWHKENINELVKKVKTRLNSGDILVDFGAGTGASALYLMKGIKKKFRLILVDNSPSWLTKAYEILHDNKDVEFFLLSKNTDRYMTLDEALGKNSVDHVASANTVHLISNIKEVFEGIYAALKKSGTFILQSGNIKQMTRTDGILMIDDSINEVHNIAIKMIKNNKAFTKYAKGLEKRIKQEVHQRKFVFPDPRSLEFYLEALKSTGFINVEVTRKEIRVYYKDWLNFLRVRRLQAGILPEVGGKDASTQEEKDRDILIKRAARILFKKLRMKNPFADAESFSTEWIYISARK